MGIGSKPLRKYGYAPIGEPAVLVNKPTTAKNLTVTATISKKKVEFV